MMTEEERITEVEDPEFKVGPQAFKSVPPRAKDLPKLGFDSFADYRLWCLREGYADGLGRSKSERESESLDPTGETATHDTAERRDLIRKTVAGQVDRRPESYDWIAGDDEAQRALLRLMLHANRYVDVLKSKRLSRGGGRSWTLVDGLVALAHHHRRWIRPLEEWSSPLPHKGFPSRVEQFSSLVRHLFARYEVPEFMDSAWFEGVGESGLRRQAWFMHVAQGGSIRDMDTPIELTRRMAHLYLHAPPIGSLEKTMRWAQVVGMGGSGALMRAIQQTRLGRRFDDDEFWSTVVLFLVNNPMLDPAWAGPIIDYVHHMKFAPRRVVREGGGVEEGPPRQPNFTMKGRSVHKLMRQVEAWHAQLGDEKYVAFQVWQPCGVRGWETEDETPELGKVHWTIQELLSSEELAAEGRAMSHCIVSYSDQCADGNTAVWSICARKEGAVERENALTAAMDIKSRTITQARGRHNALPNRRPHSAQARAEAPGGYYYLLDRASVILNRWIKREQLHRDG